MKILAVSELFPPHYIGGYELACAEVMTRLADRGHEVRVLTSAYRRPGVVDAPEQFPVDRTLAFTPASRFNPPNRDWSWRYLDVTVESAARRTVRSAVRRFRPDLISVWRLGNLALNVLPACASTGVPTAFAISDYWAHELLREDWTWATLWGSDGPATWKRSAKRGVESAVRVCLAETRLRLDLIRSAHFFSRHVQERWSEIGVSPSRATVIHHGVDLDEFAMDGRDASEPRRLLYVGRLDRLKGVHVAIQALGRLVGDLGRADATLDIVGGDLQSEYGGSLVKLAADLGLSGQVRFLGDRTRDEVNNLYKHHDILIFPSVWEEPYSIALIEAMARGLPVVATATGGTPEIVRDGMNGLLVPPDDPSATAAALARLMADPGLAARLRRQGRVDVEAQGDIRRTVDQVETFYRECAAAGSPAPAPLASRLSMTP